MISCDALTWLQTGALRDAPFSLIPFYVIHNLHSLSAKQIIPNDDKINQDDLMPQTL